MRETRIVCVLAIFFCASSLLVADVTVTDDEEGTATVLGNDGSTAVADSDGNVVAIGADGTVHTEDEDGNTVTLDKDGNVLEADVITEEGERVIVGDSDDEEEYEDDEDE